MTDMMRMMSALVLNSERPLPELPTEVVKKRKVVRRRKKKAASKAAANSTPTLTQSFQLPATQAPHAPGFQSGPPTRSTSPTSPHGMRKASHTHSPILRPHSAHPLFASPADSGGGQGRAILLTSRALSHVSMPARPGSAAPTVYKRGQGISDNGARTTALSPSARAMALSVWRDVSPPKYTEASLKQPELGTVPGTYQSPPWRPSAAQETDPVRQEIYHAVKEPRFKHILAVPAHVLAQSLFHPNAPSDRARARQLAQDLKVARSDRVQAMAERLAIEQTLHATERELASSQQAVCELKREVQQLQDSVSQLLKSHKAITVERDQLRQALDRRKLQGAS